jgi:Tol biopolymer transport system component
VGGAPAKPFTSGTHRDSSPRWSPDGRYLAFLSTRAGDEPQLYLIAVDGGEARQLTRMPNDVSSPAWSPDGSRIAFISSVDATERAWEDSGEEPPDDQDERKLWQERRKQEREKREDPRLITRFPYREGTSYLGDRYPHVYVIDVPQDLAMREKGKPKRLTDEERVYGPPVWASDGTAVLSSANRDPEGADLRFPSDILRIPVDGGEAQVVVGGVGIRHHRDPKPSPD